MTFLGISPYFAIPLKAVKIQLNCKLVKRELGERRNKEEKNYTRLDKLEEEDWT